MERTIICIDLKSFYASVECVARGLDPLTANLVVADESRTDKTICLAVSPSLKARGIPGVARLFEVKERLREVKARTGEDVELIIAKPRMAKYIEVSSDIYAIYLKYIAPEDMHVYSIDEVFIDASKYLRGYGRTARELAVIMIRDVLRSTGITATVGIGSNLYLAKIAMDIVAKHQKADADGVRIAELDEESFRRILWGHRPITDFWRIAGGTARRLEKLGVHTMGELARLSLHNERILYREFGVDAEILIDHAWGIEPCTMEDIKAYRPSSSSLSSGQVLTRPYSVKEARLVMREMTELLVLDMVDKGLVADAYVIHVGYERIDGKSAYGGPVKTDHYGRTVPVSAHGTANLGVPTASLKRVAEAVMGLFDRIVDPELEIRRLNIAAIRVEREEDVFPQLDVFTDHERERRERSIQKAMLAIHKKYGKNALLKGHDFLEGATTRERNGQIGGHRK